MASRVMPLRALVGVGALTAALGISLLAPVAASATVAVEGSTTAAPAPRAIAGVAVTATSVSLPTVVRGEPLATRNRAVTYALRGVRASAYIGSYFDKRFDARRRCIANRESHGYYTVRSRNGKYLGAYQMNTRLAYGATKRMVAGLAREVGLAQARAMTARLRTIPVNRWSRYWQDRAFWTIWNHGRGASNWAGGAYRC